MTPPHLHVVGVDPGQTTGWCLMTVPRASIYGNASSQITSWDTGEITGDEPDQVMQLARLVREIQSLDYHVGPALVVEDFDLMPANPTTDATVMLSPVRITAMIRFVLSTPTLSTLFADARLVLQPRSLAKSTATDDRLRAWGYWTIGSDHERDATRHAITALRRAKQNTDFREKLWNGI